MNEKERETNQRDDKKTKTFSRQLLYNLFIYQRCHCWKYLKKRIFGKVNLQ
jgi:hypothetical protein